MDALTIMTELNNQIFPWCHERRFNAYANYFRKEFGTRVQKLSIDAGFSCPNRDGSKGKGGCTYCNNDAFNPSYCQPEKSVSQQIQEGKDFHAWRYKRAQKYLAYFQPYSNTYAPLETLKRIYDEALNNEDIIGLVIGTRPDCIDDEKIAYFADLAKTHYVVIEYGIESCLDKTLNLINRGHDFQTAVNAIEKTAAAGIRTGTHLILGLPGETEDEILQQATTVSSLPLHSIKLHQLQILKGSIMEHDYAKHPENYKFFTLDNYIDFLIRFLEHLSPNIIVERFAGEVPPRFQAGPTFGNIRNDEILRMVEQELERRNTFQGRLVIG